MVAFDVSERKIQHQKEGKIELEKVWEMYTIQITQKKNVQNVADGWRGKARKS